MADEPQQENVEQVEEFDQPVVQDTVEATGTVAPEAEDSDDTDEPWERPTPEQLANIRKSVMAKIEGKDNEDELEMNLGMFEFYLKKVFTALENAQKATSASVRAVEEFNTSDDSEIVAFRLDYEAKVAEIAEIKAPIVAKIDDLKAKYQRKLEEYNAELKDAVGNKEDVLEDEKNDFIKELAAGNASVSPEDAIEEAKSKIAAIKKMESGDAWTTVRKYKNRKGESAERKEPIHSFVKENIPNFVEVLGRDAMEIYFGTKSEAAGKPRKIAYVVWAQIDDGPKHEGWTMTDVKKAIGLKDEDTFKAVTRHLAEVLPGKDLKQLSTTEPTSFQVTGKMGKLHTITVLGREDKNESAGTSAE